MPGEKKQKEISHRELKKKFEACEKLRDEYLTGWQRARADFLNYKKEEGQRLQNFFEVERVQIILKILPILDNLQKAANYSEGLSQIEKQFQIFLKEAGVEEIKAEESFDPNLHEAIEQVEVKGRKSGEILEVIQKGYKLNGKVIRPAKVKVSK